MTCHPPLACAPATGLRPAFPCRGAQTISLPCFVCAAQHTFSAMLGVLPCNGAAWFACYFKDNYLPYAFSAP